MFLHQPLGIQNDFIVTVFGHSIESFRDDDLLPSEMKNRFICEQSNNMTESDLNKSAVAKRNLPQLEEASSTRYPILL